MKAEDIIWGGNNKGVIRLKNDIGLEPGTLVNIEYDYIKEAYHLKKDIKRVDISASENVIEMLNNIYLTGSAPTTMVWVIDREEDLNYIIEIKVFREEITFGKLNAIKIKIGDEVIDKMRVRDKESPIAYLDNAFKYGDRVFVRGYGRKGASFTILSADRALNVRQVGNEYIATNLVRYDKSRADMEAVFILKGDLSFVDSSRSAVVSGEVAQKMEVITSSGEYFDIWDAYNDLDRIFAFRQATENGILKYSACTCVLTDAFEYCFTLEGSDIEAFPEGTQIDCTDNDDILKIDTFTKADQMGNLRSTSIGVFDRIENGMCYIIDREYDSKKNLPSQGYLFVSVVGDAVRLSRREKAKADIITKQSPINNLAMIIDKGVGTDFQSRHEAPITGMLSRKFEGREFNEEQRKAIEVAINTPDIALILGPPGTGKTTVIKAIIARFEEYYKKHNDKNVPKILVTSFQHEAVENVIVDMEGNGLPPERKGGRRDGTDKKSISIRTWRDKIGDYVGREIAELVLEQDTAHQTLRDQIYAWKSKGMDAAEGLELLKTVAEANRLKLSNKLNESINEILGRAMVRPTGQNKELQAVEDEEQEEIKKVLLAQRTTQESYADDGKKQAYALKQLILQEIVDNGGDTSVIDEVLRTKGQETKALRAYEQFVEGLKKKYVTVEKVDTAISSVDSVEQCLKEVDSELERARLERLENRNEATAYILQNFLDSIQDEKEIERIIEKYANVTAATCQQSMEVGRFAMNMTYDLVIVDEAARANPLDLLIPVSMGKQVILVGDHKQLPHMLDPDVVKQFETDEKMQELGVLQESLFERLFNMFSQSEGRVKRTARLSKQYRMHPIIGEFASDNFYGEYKLDSSEVRVEDKTAHMNGLYNDCPIAWLNLDKNNYGMEIGRCSKKREKEAARIIKEVKKVLAVDPKKSIGIISFYKSQSDYLKDIAKTELTDAQNDRIEIGTVDAFQGKEFDVVFLSCVRANVIELEDRRHRIGHIDDLSRLCVSFTRARQLMVAVGDRETVECVPALADFIRRCREGGSYYE